MLTPLCQVIHPSHQCLHHANDTLIPLILTAVPNDTLIPLILTAVPNDTRIPLILTAVPNH